MAIVYLAFGSNLGHREENIQHALQALERPGIRIQQISTVIETEPMGGPPGQKKYLNGVLKAETALSPEELLLKLKSIESLLGRKERERNAPREIDLDILLYDDKKIQLPQLTIPHPRMHERDFVLTPLKEIFPDYAHH